MWLNGLHWPVVCDFLMGVELLPNKKRALRPLLVLCSGLQAEQILENPPVGFGAFFRFCFGCCVV
jgi:hypothetical protein